MRVCRHDVCFTFLTNRVLAQVIICGRKLNRILTVYFGDPEEQIVLTPGKISISLFWSEMQQLQTTKKKSLRRGDTLKKMTV